MHAAERARAIEFICMVEDVCAEHRLPCPGGHAILDSHHPHLWDANHLRVESPQAPDAEALATAAEQHLGGKNFRMLTFLCESAVPPLRDPLARHGYQAANQLLMILRNTPPPGDPGITIMTVTSEELQASRVASLIEDTHHDELVGRELISRDAVIATAATLGCYAAVDTGEIVARCQTYTSGGIAQIEHVYTHAAFRGRGCARALVTSAARDVRRKGADLVFLVADATDWPRDFYNRLGFADAGLLPRLLRYPV
ncbi:MAG: GNAT family N-acetyltransferase [Solirubrobacteraceae bacterium]